MRFAKTVFLIAGIYGLAVVVPLYFLEERIGRQFPPAISHPDFYYGFVGVTLSWQFLFLVLAGDPLRYRSMMLPAILEKVTYVAALLVLFLQQRIPSIALAPGLPDAILAILFLASYIVTRANFV
jgi:hypothetical protein